jgi:hypothetical protein
MGISPSSLIRHSSFPTMLYRLLKPGSCFLSSAHYPLPLPFGRAGEDLETDPGENFKSSLIPLVETDIEVNPNGPPIRILLGAGAILGQMPGKWEVGTYEMGRVFVAPEAGSRPIRENAYYVGSSFEVRFVPPIEPDGRISRDQPVVGGRFSDKDHDFAHE